jgi:FtsZ-binding cell division protein ZapB
MTTKPYVYTIVLQEEKIKELTKRNKQLERGYLSVTRVNDRLRRQIARLKRRENELDNVNI